MSFFLFHQFMDDIAFALHFTILCSCPFFVSFLGLFFLFYCSLLVFFFQVLLCWLLCIIYKEFKTNQLCWFILYCFLLVFCFFKFYCVGFLCRYMHDILKQTQIVLFLKVRQATLISFYL